MKLDNNTTVMDIENIDSIKNVDIFPTYPT